MSEIKVYLQKRQIGAHKICPDCRKRNRVALKSCSKCTANLEGIKRSYDGKKAIYILRWIDPKTGREKAESLGTDKTFARNKQSQKRQELISGSDRSLTKIRFDEFVTEHLHHIKMTLSHESYEQHERTLRAFKKVCHPRDMQVIDFQMLENFRTARLCDGVTPGTVNKYLRTLQGILARAVTRRYMEHNPFKGNRKVLYVPEPEIDIVTITFEEFQTLLTACPDDRWLGICIIGYYSGLRSMEICSLQWSDVYFENSLLHVSNKDHHSTKSRKVRIIPMSDEVVEILRKLQVGRFKSKFIFTSKRLKGEKMENNIGRDFEKVVIKAGLVDEEGEPKITLHDLRRTFVTDMLLAGTDIKTVQALSGHKSVAVLLKYYAAASAKQKAAAIQKRSRQSKGIG